MGVARRFTLKENAIEELDLEEIEVPVPHVVRYLVHQHLGHAVAHQLVVIVVVLHLNEELLLLGVPGEVGQLGVQPVQQWRGEECSALQLDIVLLIFQSLMAK